ncbi:hypothetical protein PPSIR1_06101 [Plesiocystis pacifica SIR-1]|uniref:Uncharacterized protein n=1 Tax=Plesiocystis pacifica SIR-1 TaxID=391625 RepID=A6G6U5_9BACT|nr:hypothetical protein [Plesiocystis pacifica]EDM78398.1 hypothetical protein PPSIR1_06101 [Plesiocystis pacifica SIR-1]
MKGDLVQLRDRSHKHESALARHEADIEELFDALTIYMTHADGLPETARETIMGKLARKRRRGVTGPVVRG